MGGQVAPKFDPARRNARNGPRKLPASGRKGPVPDWPLPGKPTAVERDAWRDLWATPQSVIWEELGWTRNVARFCRVMCEAEKRGASTMVRAECRQMEDRLGLTPKSMRMLLWEVVNDAPANTSQHAATVEDIRKRIKAV